MVFSTGQTLSLLEPNGSLGGVFLAPPGSPDDVRPPDTLCTMGGDGAVLAIGDGGSIGGSNPRVDPEHTVWGWAAVLGEEDFAPPPEPDCSGNVGAQLCEQTIVPTTVRLRSRKRPIAVTLPELSVPGLKFKAVGLMAQADGGGTRFIVATNTKRGKLKTDKTTTAKIKLTGATWKRLKSDEVLSLVLQIDVSQGQTPLARLARPMTVVLEEKEGGGGGEEDLVVE
jgi:hypothetical protein